MNLQWTIPSALVFNVCHTPFPLRREKQHQKWCLRKFPQLTSPSHLVILFLEKVMCHPATEASNISTWMNSLFSFPGREIPAICHIPPRLIQTQKVPCSVCMTHSISNVNTSASLRDDQRNCTTWRSLQSNKVPRGIKVRVWSSRETKHCFFS